jgi:hypothetical protein
LIRGEKSQIGVGVMLNGRMISVRPIVRPEPDLRLLAKVFLYMPKRDLDEHAKQDRAA